MGNRYTIAYGDGLFWIVLYLLAPILLLSGFSQASTNHNYYFLIEAEEFDQLGDWRVQTDGGAFGGAYLMGRSSKGAGANTAETKLYIPETGEYTIWVRARDFTQDPGARYFEMSLGELHVERQFGRHGRNGWEWERAGTFQLTEGSLTVCLHDTSQYWARVDALLFTTDPYFVPPNTRFSFPAFVTRGAPQVIGSARRAFQDSLAQLDFPDGEERKVYTLENDYIRVTFREMEEGNAGYILRETALRVDGSWQEDVLPPTVITFLVLYSPLGNLAEFDPRGSSQFPTWNRMIDPIDTSLREAVTSVYYSGEPLWAVPSRMEVIDQQTVCMTSETEDFILSARWFLPADGLHLQVTLSLTAKKEGYFSMGVVDLPEYELADIDSLLLPYMWANKRLPVEPFLALESYLPAPVALVTRKEEERQFTYGLFVEPSEIPFRWTRHSDSRFGMAIKGPGGGAKPALFMPVLGLEDSHFNRNESYSFSYRYLLMEGDWFAAYRDVVENVYGLRDYRQNWEGSLTDAVFNMTDLLMHESAAGWDPDGKGHYNMEKPDIVTQAAPLVPLQMYLLTEDEELYAQRALPTLEYLLSRDSIDYRLGTGLGGPVKHFYTSTYGGVDKMTFGLNPAFREIAYGLGVKHGPGYNKIPWWSEALWAYRLTGEEGYLQDAVSGAQAYIEQEIYGIRTADLGEEPFVYTDFVPYWPALLDLYEVTQDPEHLKAAEAGARILLTTVWVQPAIPEGTMVVSRDSMLKRANSWTQLTVHQSSRYHLRQAPGEELVTDEVVPTWVVSKVGLGLEQPWTYRAHGCANILLSSWAPDLMRLAGYTGDSLYATYARNAVVGRYTNYPGYYLGLFSTWQMKPEFPLIGPDVTRIYYHHIPAQLALTVDFLVTEAWYRSEGRIEFPAVRQQGFVWFSNKVYGFAPGCFYGDEDVWLWFDRDAVRLDNLLINHLTAKKNGTLYIALMNTSDASQRVSINLAQELIAGMAPVLEVYDEATDSWSQLDTGSMSGLTVPGKGLVALKLSKINVTEPTFAELYQTTVLVPSNVVQRDGLLENVYGTIIMSNPNYYDAYVYTKYGSEAYGSVTLHFAAGEDWDSVTKTEAPFEFTVRVNDPKEVFRFYLEVVNKANIVRKTGTYELTPPKVQ